VGEHAPTDPSTVEVADGVFAYVQPDGSWWINNTGFVVGGDAVVAVDASSTERRTRALLDAITRVTPSPVRTLVNTHHHGDHTNGNCLFARERDAVIVGHRECRESVIAGGRIGGPFLDSIFGEVDWGELTIEPPSVTFDSRLDLWAGSRRVELHYIGMPAHTTGDVVAWLPEQRVLFAGDLLFNGGTPFVLMGSVAGSLDALDRVAAFGAETIVPGHGRICDAAALDVIRRYLRFVQDTAKVGREAGLAPLDVARTTDLGEFAELLDPERLVGNLHRAYAELDGQPLGAPVDLVAAFTDMVAFNGGQPLRCHA
jgi:cyclase